MKCWKEEDVKNYRLDELKPGMKLAEDLSDFHGRILLTWGTEVTSGLIKNLKAWGISAVKVLGSYEEEPSAAPGGPPDIELVKEAKREADRLFRLSNPDNPHVEELLRLFVRKKIQKKSRG